MMPARQSMEGKAHGATIAGQHCGSLNLYHHHGHHHQCRRHHPKVGSPSSSGPSQTPLRCRQVGGALATDPSAAFVLAVEDALASCDIDSPGARTAPPQHPSLSAIRQSPEVYRAVWKEYYQLRSVSQLQYLPN
ncbi:unnamed protein product [Rodentolepis nana]|uniref:Uncharacterized protein n=1 Tax=Rodentolepis nana TaxID=102285 RepID=A0A0R3TPG0_RODNA|nr:unnamed protein product [Rodentolepis nana]